MAFLPSSRKLTRAIQDHLGSLRFDPASPPPADPAWPKITIITPSFNQASFLERTILSIHNQEYPNLEHIVIDGGSTDGSLEILRRYQKRFHFWQTAPDGGQSDAINIGASRATGDYMMWINSDDVLLPGSLDNMARVFVDHPDTELVFGNQVEVDESDRVIKRVFTIDFDILDFLYEINIIVPQQSAIWNVDLFHKIGGLKLYRYAMDYDLVYRMYRAGARFHRIPDFLSAFRVHPAGLTGSGEVASGRGEEVDQVFRDFMERDRTFFDKTFMKYRYKMGRFISQPRSLLAAMEHRARQWTVGRRSAKGAGRRMR